VRRAAQSKAQKRSRQQMRKSQLQGQEAHMTRREMLQVTAGLGMTLALESTGTVRAAEPDGLVSLDLAGDMWSMHEESQAQSIPAVVPGSTYSNLLRAGKIPDPFFGENNGKVQWVAEKNWIFRRTFETPKELLARRQVQLVCHGLDTLATVWLNGRQIGSADNMFRTWPFDVRPHLRKGTNHLEIRFDTLAPYVESHRNAYKQRYGIDLHNPRSWVRKGPYMWGWDWCRPVLTQGIWKKIEILGFDSRLADLGVFQDHQSDGSVRLDIQATVLGGSAGSAVKAQVSLAGTVVAEATGPVAEGVAVLHTVIPKPQLWWPNGIGDQPLYTVTAQLTDANGQIADTAKRRIGLRKVEVQPPKEGVAMHLRVNGAPVFAKGADWIPADNLPSRVTPVILSWYMTRAVECNFNFIRLWGGGYYEEDELFDLCDELGIMLQFEFKFANASYPVEDKIWMDNLQAEIEEQTRRCRNHPSIVIWSGNNEIQYFKGYERIFQDVIGGIVHRLLPGAFYEVGSGAHGSGDIHTWGVWHGNKPAESYGTIEGFVTEFGMQSLPVPMTVDSYTNASDRQSVDSPVMRYHELDGSGHGIEKIMRFTESDFGKAPDSFDDTLWLTQLNQAWTMRYGVEHWRRDMPRSMAAAIWQYNDCWPGATWAMVDYYRRWKAVLYQSQHFFAPLLVSGVPDAKTGQAEIYVTSDLPRDVSGELCWWVTNLAGDVLRQGSKQIDIPARTSRLAEALDLADVVSAQGAAKLLIWPEVTVGGRRAAENTLLFVRPRELKLQEPKLEVRTSGGEREYAVLIETDVPALWVWANLNDTDAAYSDNFLNMRRGRTAEIRVTLDKPMTPFDFRRKLVIRSVYDIAPEMRGTSAPRTG
jgi:beta-mannosidase